MPKTFTLSLSDAAKAVVRFETDGDKIVYSNYIEAHGVTLDTVGEHVAALADLAVEMKRIDPTDKAEIKRFKNKVRNGLNYRLGKVSEKSGTSDKYVTAEGLKAESWDAFITKARAEWDAANNK